jgi:hypothetical protein
MRLILRSWRRAEWTQRQRIKQLSARIGSVVAAGAGRRCPSAESNPRKLTGGLTEEKIVAKCNRVFDCQKMVGYYVLDFRGSLLRGKGILAITGDDAVVSLLSYARFSSEKCMNEAMIPGPEGTWQRACALRAKTA